MYTHISNHISYKEATEIMKTQTNAQLICSHSEKHIKLPPKFLGNVQAGIKEQLDLTMSLFDTQLDGVPIAYTGIKLLDRLGKVVSDQTCVHLDIEAEFIVFQPHLGCKLEGVINKVGKHHLGCLVHGCFNAWLPRAATQSTRDAEKERFLGRKVTFTLTGIFTNNDILSMKGSVLSMSQEELSSPNTNIRFPDAADDKSEITSNSLELSADADIEAGPDMQPLFTSTQIGDVLFADPDSDTTAQQKKKTKRKKRKDHNDELVQNMSFNSVPSDGDTLTKIKTKQKKKDRRKSNGDEVVQKLFFTGMSDTDNQHQKEKKLKRDKHKDCNISTGDVHDFTSDMDISTEKKGKRKKHKATEHNTCVDSVNAVEYIVDTIGEMDRVGENKDNVLSGKKKHKKKRKSECDVSTDGVNLTDSSQFTVGSIDMGTPSPRKKKKDKSRSLEIKREVIEGNESVSVDHLPHSRKHKLHYNSDTIDSGIGSPKRRMLDTFNADNSFKKEFVNDDISVRKKVKKSKRHAE